MFRSIITLLILVFPALLSAQDNTNIMYTNGKIYVVIAVIATIFVGLGLYLYALDRKISKIENEK